MELEYRKLKTVVIREELFAITRNTTQAIILGQLLYWTDKVKDIDKYIIEETKRRNAEGIDTQCDIPLSYGWIYKKASELIEECLLDASPQKCRRHLQALEEKGFIDSQYNPNLRYDRTLQYRVNFVNILAAIYKEGYRGLQGYVFTFKMENSELQYEILKLQNGNLKLQNGEAIPEITNIDYNKEDKSSVKSDADEKDSAEESVDDFVKRMYALYPAKCPKRGSSTGKCQKDKLRIKKLLETYTMSQIEAVFNQEINEKYKTDYLKNFSTFLNNFPDPDEYLLTKSENVSEIEEKDGNSVYKW